TPGAAFSGAGSAAARSPVAIASSTLRTKLRIFERRALLISVRRAILRVALRAELVLAMPVLILRAIARPVHAISQKASAAARASPPTRAAYSGPAWERQRQPPLIRPALVARPGQPGGDAPADRRS